MPSLLPAAPLIMRRRYLILMPRPMPAAPRMYLAVVYRLFPRRRSLCVACAWSWCQDRCLRP
jgi:hypothetical protein